MLKFKECFLTIFILCFAAGCGGSRSDSASGQKFIPYSFNRLNATQFELIIDTTGINLFNIGELNFICENGSATAWSETGDRIFKTTITADNPSGEIPLHLEWGSYKTVTRAVILPTIDSGWNQPESVPGLVNTDGWEDSPEISPDGQYLIVSTYTPVSIFQCIIDGGLRATASCNDNSFHALQGYRPNMPGADRIISGTEIDHSISLLDPPDTTSAFPPVSSYVFKKQYDGSFRDPRPIYVDMEGYTWGAPFGFNFRRKISEGVYEIYLAFGDPTLGDGNRLQKAEINFNPVLFSLGRIFRSGGFLVKSDWKLTPLTIGGFTGQAGNPGTTLYGKSDNGFLFWDDESLTTGQRKIFFTTETPAGVLGSQQIAGLSNPGTDKYQPYFFQDRLYYSLVHGLILSQEILSTADLTQAVSWGSARVELAIDSAHTHSGRITAIGEPSLYTDSGGKKWIYFAYSIAGSGHLDLNIARVQQR